ncbi:MAG: hypothetical protein C0514_04100 [Candidatus Puniceispirillum sp.]|nr:hypothetical protein [Candidatus Puniceispirillum sp.]
MTASIGQSCACSLLVKNIDKDDVSLTRYISYFLQNGKQNMIIKSPTVFVVSLCAGVVSSYALASDMRDENQTSSLKRKAPSQLVKIGDTKRQCISAFALDETSPDPSQRAPLEEEGRESMKPDHSASVDENPPHALKNEQAIDAALSEQENTSSFVLGSAAWMSLRTAYESAPHDKHEHFHRAAQLYDSALACPENPDARIIVCALLAHYDLAEFEPEEQSVRHLKETIRLFDQALGRIRLPSHAYLYAAKAHIKIGEGSCVQERFHSVKTARTICEDGLNLYPDSRNLLKQTSVIHKVLCELYEEAHQKAVAKKEQTISVESQDPLL